MQNKQMIRKELLQKRGEMSHDEVLQKSEQISKNLLASGLLSDATVVLSYLPLKNEVLTDRIHQYLWDQNILLLVPYTDENYNIVPCKLTPNSRLTTEKFGVKVPGNKEFYHKEPDLVLVPCVGIDPLGNRIGFGKGCYDRYLTGKHSKTIALLFSFQVIPYAFPHQNDIPIDRVLTEDGFLK